MIKKSSLLLVLCLGLLTAVKSQTHDLIGYWHNWNDANAPYIQLDQIDTRYTIIEVAFATPVSTTDMTMQFTPDVVTSAVFISKVQALQAANKKVLISIGGATGTIDLTTTANKNAFINSMTSILNTYGFDGIDIDVENGASVTNTGGTIANPTNVAQLNLIDAIKQIMQTYHATYNKKLMLTMAPETAYVQGGQSAFAGIWGGYLPIIHALKDSIDILQVQLYNSGSMYGIDNNVYNSGTADFISAMTEAGIHGFTTSGGPFLGLPANKIAVGLPACTSAAGSGYITTSVVKSAIDYIRGVGANPGSYNLTQSTGYPDLRGMMTWSINWDAVASCNGAYSYAANYQVIFGLPTTNQSLIGSDAQVSIYPNPVLNELCIDRKADAEPCSLKIMDVAGRVIMSSMLTQTKNKMDMSRLKPGMYGLQIGYKSYRFVKE